LDQTRETLAAVSPAIRKHFKILGRGEFLRGKTRIPLTVPTYGPREVEESLDSMLSTWVSMGQKVKRFEQLFARYLGCKYAVMVNSGSSANLLALAVLTNPILKDRIKPGSEVITPAVTWVTTVYPIHNMGCIPVLVDVDLQTFNIKPEAAREAVTSRTAAVMPVHLLGNPCKINDICKMADANHLFVVEDACESTGAEIRGKKVGTFGDMGTFSFYMSHHISTIEGGMVVTDNEELYEYLKAMRAFGWIRDLKHPRKFSDKSPGIDPRFLFFTLGFNLRPTEIQGAFGIHQIPKLNSFIQRRRRNAAYWNRRLRGYRDILALPEEKPETKHVYFGYPITVKQGAPITREQLVTHLERKLIETRPIMAGNIAEQPSLSQMRHRVSGDLTNSRLIMRGSFFFGNHNGIGDAEREYIGDSLVDFLDSNISR